MCTPTERCEVLDRVRAGTCVTTRLRCEISPLLTRLVCPSCHCGVTASHVPGSSHCDDAREERGRRGHD